MPLVEIFSDTVELAELICQSEEAQNYLRLQKQLRNDHEAQKIITGFQKVKENYEDAQRFGRFHPNYHEAKREAQRYQKEMFSHSLIQAYLESEKMLDKLLYDVSCVLANSVSTAIMVPNDLWNKPNRGCKCKE